jgi:excisionase family DNA binding protein
MKKPELTVKELAALERVTERTVYNWIEKGAVEVRRTPGGQIRIADSRVPFITLKNVENY